MKHSGFDPQHFTDKGRSGGVREKRAYSNKAAARRAIESRGGSGGVYLCRHCGHWHITTRTTPPLIAKPVKP